MLNSTIGPQYVPASTISAEPTKPISLIFLANRAFYQNAVNDRWFNATVDVQRQTDLGNTIINETFYLSENPGSILACHEQVQIW